MMITKNTNKVIIASKQEFEKVIKHIALVDGYTKINNLIEYSSLSGITPYRTKTMLALLRYIEVLVVKKNNITINPELQEEIEKDIPRVIVTCVFSTLLKNGVLREFIQKEALHYDYHLKMIVINNTLIPSKYAHFRNTLIELGFFIRSDNAYNILAVSKEYEIFFETTILNYLKINQEYEDLKLSKTQLDVLLKRKSVVGSLAEDFVVDFEHRRLGSKNKQVKRISDIDVSAGYDVLSYMSTQSLLYDRFIEVKSYVGETHFYWSRNEINQARIKNDDYYLYIVDRDLMEDSEYVPTIIKNPYTEVYESNSWSRRCENYYITKED